MTRWQLQHIPEWLITRRHWSWSVNKQYSLPVLVSIALTFSLFPSPQWQYYVSITLDHVSYEAVYLADRLLIIPLDPPHACVLIGEGKKKPTHALIGAHYDLLSWIFTAINLVSTKGFQYLTATFPLKSQRERPVSHGVQLHTKTRCWVNISLYALRSFISIFKVFHIFGK